MMINILALSINWEFAMHRDLRNVDLNLLIVLNALAEEQHLTKAAEKLHMSQPAVSNALSRLRSLFDDELFVRAPKGMRPTPKAKALQEPIRQALGLIQEQFTPRETFDYTTAKHHFCISVNGYAEFVVLPPMMRGLRALAPNITLDICPESDARSPELLRTGEIDLAMDYIEIAGKDFIKEPFYSEELVVVTTKNHPKIKGPVDLELYKALPHVAVRPRNHRGSHTEIVLGRKQIKRKVVMSVSDLISLPAIAAQTDLICTLNKRLAHYFAKTLPIDIHALPFDTEAVPVYMYYHRDKQKDPAHTWLREQIKRVSKIN
jgi:DNA-binding transcriptional LysR family regulator